MRISRLSALLASLSLAFGSWAEAGFSAPDINARNEVLFSLSVDLSANRSFSTLFLKKLDSSTLEQLTVYPEAIESLANGRIVQVRNRLGIGRFDVIASRFSWVDDSRPFVKGGDLRLAGIPVSSTSPDGRWIASVEPSSPSRGVLAITDVSRNVRRVIAESVDRAAVPVSWAPDSSIMIYAVQGSLHFARPETFFSSSAVGESFRVLGPGSVANISWYAPSRFLYAQGSSVYRVHGPELFARSLYARLIGAGDLAGKIPFDFNPAEDSLFASPGGQSALLCRGSRTVCHIALDGDDYSSVAGSATQPWLLLPGNTASVNVGWMDPSRPVIYTRSVDDGKLRVRAWKLVDAGPSAVFQAQSVPHSARDVIVSPNGGFAAFILADSLKVYSVATWKETGEYRGDVPASACWADDTRIFVGGERTITLWDTRSLSSELLLLSSAPSYGWDEQGTAPLAETPLPGRVAYIGDMRWAHAPAAKLRTQESANGTWRLYIDAGKGPFKSMLFVRSALNPAGTRPILELPSRASASCPKKVALVFDAMDDADGLAEILHALSARGIRATFFVNGEFIRRNPAAAREISKAGHQCGSLFFSTWDLASPGFRVDSDFIKQGLARNEDDFYNATGQELSLVWHAPHYVSSPLIEEAGSLAGYAYVRASLAVPDWITEEHERVMPGLYRDASSIIDGIAESARDGDVIPVRIGKPIGTRKDYLYSRIDALIAALWERGFEIVSVDALEAENVGKE